MAYIQNKSSIELQDLSQKTNDTPPIAPPAEDQKLTTIKIIGIISGYTLMLAGMVFMVSGRLIITKVPNLSDTQAFLICALTPISTWGAGYTLLFLCSKKQDAAGPSSPPPDIR